MDERERTKQVMARARAILDPELIARQEAEHAAWLAAHADELADARLDELVAKSQRLQETKQRKERGFDQGIVYKRNDNARPQAQPQAMSAAASKDWNEWLDRRVKKWITWYNNDQMVPLTRNVGRSVAELEKAVKELRAELDALRAEQTNKTVVDLPDFRKRGNG